MEVGMADVTEADVKSLETKLQAFADGLGAGEREVLDAVMSARNLADADTDNEVEGFQWIATGHWQLQYNGLGYSSGFVFDNMSWYDAPPSTLPAGNWRYFFGPGGQPVLTLER
jgi:hypothetical protein